MKKTLYSTFVLLAMMFVAFSFTACTDDDYLNEMMLSNYTIYNWHDAYIQFMDSKNNYKKKKSIGTLEKTNHTYIQREEEYFFIEFKDDNGKQHTTEKYLCASTVRVETVAK